MSNMNSNIRKFIIIALGISVIFIIFAIYRDIRINKLFNYSTNPKNIGFRELVVKNGNTTIEYDLDFTATDDFLGAVYVPVQNLSGVDGEVFFKISDKNNNRLLYEHAYDFIYFKNLKSYLFGFPVIEKSNNTSYRISLVFTSNNNQSFGGILTENDSEHLQAKYVFPRNTIFKNPIKFIFIIRNRAIASVMELNYFKIILSIVFVSLIIVLVSNSEYFKKNISGPKNIYSLIPRILQPKFSFIFFILAFVTLVSIPLLVVLNHLILAEKIAEYVWIFLFLGFSWYIISLLVADYLARLINIASSLYIGIASVFKSGHRKRYILIILFIVILLSGLNKTYYLGGDDTRLFYLYPKEFLLNFASKIASDTALSGIVTMAPPVTAPLAIIMVFFKKIVGFLNLQSILYTANIIGGFVSFFFLLNFIIPHRNKFSNLINVISSFVYVFSIFNIYTLYNSRLIAIFLISMFPLSVYLFLKAIKERKPVFLLILAIISSILSFFVLAAPWFLAILITLVPFFIYNLWGYKARTLKYLLILSLLMLILNFHWIIYLGNSSVFNRNQGAGSSVVSSDYRSENEDGIRKVAELNSVFYPLMNTYHRTIVENFGWSYLPVLSSWSLQILPFNLIFLFVFIIAGLYLKKNNPINEVYLSVLFSFLLSVYLFTVNISPWGTDLFVWLNNNIPGFVLFRNMYDKFAFSLAFTFAMLLAISMHILVENFIKNKTSAYMFVIIIILVIFNTKPLILGEYKRAPIWTTQNTFDSIRAFNDDFIDLINYIGKSEDLGKYLILPLSSGNAFPIQDKYQPNHFYNGVSPLLVLSGKNDFSGLLSFGEMGNNVLSSLKEKDYNQIGKILQKFNIKYIIVNHTISDELKTSFVYSDKLFYLQGEDMLNQLVGQKIKDFGQRYSLYEINRHFNNQKIYLTANTEVIAPDNNDNLTYKKVNTYLYEINIKNLNDNESLIFLDPYLQGWKLTNNNLNLSDRHFVALGYANGWNLSSLNQKVSNVDLKLYFRTHDYFWFANIVSLIGYTVCLLIILRVIVSNRLTK